MLFEESVRKRSYVVCSYIIDCSFEVIRCIPTLQSCFVRFPPFFLFFCLTLILTSLQRAQAGLFASFFTTLSRCIQPMILESWKVDRNFFLLLWISGGLGTWSCSQTIRLIHFFLFRAMQFPPRNTSWNRKIKNTCYYSYIDEWKWIAFKMKNGSRMLVSKYKANIFSNFFQFFLLHEMHSVSGIGFFRKIFSIPRNKMFYWFGEVKFFFLRKKTDFHEIYRNFWKQNEYLCMQFFFRQKS